MVVLKQKTVKKEVVFHGKTLFTGKEIVVRLVPASPNAGIFFTRTDVASPRPIPAQVDRVQPTVHSTKVGEGDHSIQTIEHFLAAVHACEIDNLQVDISGEEMPIFDGSSLHFLQILDQAGVVEQNKQKIVYKLDQSVHWSDGEMHLIALPAPEYRISYTLHYPHSPYLQSQYYSIAITPENFRKEIAPSRTFALYQDLVPLIEKGLLKSTSFEHGVVIDGDKVLNPEGVRFPDEMVRHKILDLIGDIALVGCPFVAHLIAIKTGHAANHAFAKELKKFLRRI